MFHYDISVVANCTNNHFVSGAENYWRQLKDETGVTKIEIKCEEMNGSGDWFFERGAYKLYKGDKNIQDRK